MKKIITLMLSLVITISASAQDTTYYLKPVTLTGIEVTGVRTDSKTPITQKTLTSEDISKTYHGQEMTYILENTPSVTTQSDGGQPNGYTTFRLRGIDQTRINMTLNGVPLNEPEDQGVYFSNYPNFITNIKSLQIQRGVGTSANGTASYGGSINFEGKTGLVKETTAELGYGSFNTQHGSISYASGINKHNLALYVGLNSYLTDGYKYNSGGSGNSAFVSGGYYGGKNVIKFTGFTGHSLNKMAWFAVSEDDINIDPRTNYNPAGENDDFRQSFGQVQYVRGITRNSTLTTTAYYNRLDGNWGYNLTNTPFSQNNLISQSDLLKFKLSSNFYGLMSNYHLEVGKLNLNLGIHGNSYDRTHGGSILDTILYSNTGTKTDYSIYSKIGYTLGKFTIFGDLQARHVNFIYKGDVNMTPLSWFFINPKGGVTFNQSNKTNYYFSVGQNHREPTRNDMFSGNDNLISLNIITPEEVIDYELGSNLNFTKLKLQYNLFYMDFKNEITLLGAVGSNSLPLMTNVSKSYRSGVELDLTYNLNKYFLVTNSSNYSYYRINDGGKEYQPLYVPNFIINQGIEYTNKGFIIGLQGRYQTSSYINLDNTSSIPSYYIVNANIGYTYKTLSLIVHGLNLTNEKYYTSGMTMGTSTRYLYVNAPLSGYITLKLSL